MEDIAFEIAKRRWKFQLDMSGAEPRWLIEGNSWKYVSDFSYMFPWSLVVNDVLTRAIPMLDAMEKAV